MEVDTKAMSLDDIIKKNQERRKAAAKTEGKQGGARNKDRQAQRRRFGNADGGRRRDRARKTGNMIQKRRDDQGNQSSRVRNRDQQVSSILRTNWLCSR